MSKIKTKASITKKASDENFKVTPIHCACINPNTKFLKELYNQCADKQIKDSQWRMPVHYAAACESPDPLKFLADQKSQDVTVKDERGITPLMVACQTGRNLNVKVILNKDASTMNFKTKEGRAAIHYASLDDRNLECIKEMKTNVNSKDSFDVNLTGPERMTPLIIASTYGQLKTVKWLME